MEKDAKLKKKTYKFSRHKPLRHAQKIPHELIQVHSKPASKPHMTQVHTSQMT